MQSAETVLDVIGKRGERGLPVERGCTGRCSTRPVGVNEAVPPGRVARHDLDHDGVDVGEAAWIRWRDRAEIWACSQLGLAKSPLLQLKWPALAEFQSP